MCYTYDSLNRVTKRTVKSLESDTVLSEENYTYDAAGNITDAPDSCFLYDTNNRLAKHRGRFSVLLLVFDLKGEMICL